MSGVREIVHFASVFAPKVCCTPRRRGVAEAPLRVRKFVLNLVLLLGLACVCNAPIANAYIPKASKIRGAVAGVNQRNARGTGLRLQVVLFSGAATEAGGQTSDGKTLLAKGELATHPSGLARLELRGTQNQIERHLMRGGEYLASRNGVMLSDPRPLLFPAFLLQAGDANSLANLFAALGGANEEVALGLLDDRDCYVLGGRSRDQHDSASPVSRSALWIDKNSFEFVAIDLASGTRYRLGPLASFQGVQFPKWISIEKPGLPAFRLEVQAGAKSTLATTEFQNSWVNEQPDLIPAPVTPAPSAAPAK